MPYRTIYHNRGIEMPEYYKRTEDVKNDTQTLEGNLTLKLEPANTFRRIFKKWLPYLTGDSLNLRLKITSTLNTPEKGVWRWDLYDYGVDKKKRVVEQRSSSQDFTIEARTTTTVYLKTLILYESEYHIDVQCPKTQQRTLLSFYAMSRDVYRAQWSTSLMSGVIGGLLGIGLGFWLSTLGKVNP